MTAAAVSMHHVGFWIHQSEVDRTLEFYREMLAFHPVSRKPRKSGGERIILRNSSRQYIEILVSDAAATLDSYPRHPKERVAGIAHLCFEVPDLVEMRQISERLGLAITLQAPADGGYNDSELGTHRILFVQAPGGVTVELFEFQRRVDP